MARGIAVQNDASWFAREQKQRMKKFENPSPVEHIEAAQDHIRAANDVQLHDHESAADHLQKAAVHAQAAGSHYQKNSEKWIQKALAGVKGHPFKAKAEKAGMSTAAFAAKESKPGSKADAKTKKQAVLAKTLGGMHKK
jgi:hypothetical protein